MSRMVFDALPETLEVKGRALLVDTDFRTWMEFEQLLREAQPDEWKAEAALGLCYREDRLFDMAEAMRRLFEFYVCGEPESERPKKKAGKIQKRIYDYERDIKMIYAAFRAQYGINLQTIEHLHWWEFRAMFEGLTEDHLIVKVIGYRGIDLTQIKNKSERQRYAALQSQWLLPNATDEKEKVEAAGNIFAPHLPT